MIAPGDRYFPRDRYFTMRRNAADGLCSLRPQRTATKLLRFYEINMAEN